jgi:hypothetical protein
VGWVVGFTDGEGCFSVSFIKNPTTKTGWQIFPEFVVTQGAKSIQALRELQRFFQCGGIFINKRYDNHNENLYRYCVRSVKELEERIIPFFRKHQLRTSKQKDFELFAEVVALMRAQQHLTSKGMKRIAQLAEKMNRKVPSRFLASSETVRQTPT